MKTHTPFLMLLVLAVAAPVGFAQTAAAAAQSAPAAAPAPAANGEAALRAAIAQRGGRGAPPAVPLPPPVYRGVDLAKAPVTTQVETLPNLFEERPAGSKSYTLRPAVTPTSEPFPVDAVIYWVKDRNCFYIQYDQLGSSTHHFYGPFAGDPDKVLLPRAGTLAAPPAAAPAAQPATPAIRPAGTQTQPP